MISRFFYLFFVRTSTLISYYNFLKFRTRQDYKKDDIIWLYVWRNASNIHADRLINNNCFEKKSLKIVDLSLKARRNTEEIKKILKNISII